MADPLSVVASIVGIAGAGIQLSTTLYTYAETAFYVDKSLQDIARDVSLTSSVLGQLGELIKQDKQAKLCSENALKTADEAVTGCRAVFTEIDTALQKSLKKTGDGKAAVSKLQRLKWPLVEPKMKLLQGNLDRLKSTLLLMLNVLAYAKKLKEENPLAEEQRVCIQRLIQVNQESTAKFEQLEKLLSQQSLAKATPSPGVQTAVLAPPTPPPSNSSPVSSLEKTQCLCGKPFQAGTLHFTERDIMNCLFWVNTVRKAIRNVQSPSPGDTLPTEEQICSKFLEACRMGHDVLRLFVESENAQSTGATNINNIEPPQQKVDLHEMGHWLGQLHEFGYECGVDGIKPAAPTQLVKCIEERSAGSSASARSDTAVTTHLNETRSGKEPKFLVRTLCEYKGGHGDLQFQFDDIITILECPPGVSWYQGSLRGTEGRVPSHLVQALHNEHLVQATYDFKYAKDGWLCPRKGDIIRVLGGQGGVWKGSLRGQVGLFSANATVKINAPAPPTSKPPHTVPAIPGPKVERPKEKGRSSGSSGDWLTKVASQYSDLRRCPPSKATVSQPSEETSGDTGSSKPSIDLSSDERRQRLNSPESRMKTAQPLARGWALWDREPTPAVNLSKSSKPKPAQIRQSHSEQEGDTAGADPVDLLLRDWTTLYQT